MHRDWQAVWWPIKQATVADHAVWIQRLASNGSVAENVEIRLLDLPELGYLTSDCPPRGEILARTPYMAGQVSTSIQRVWERQLPRQFPDCFQDTSACRDSRNKANLQ